MENTEIQSHQDSWHKPKSSTLHRPRVALQMMLQKQGWATQQRGSPADLRRQLASGQYILEQEQELEPLLLFGSAAGAENS